MNRRTLSIILVVGVVAVGGFFAYRQVTGGSTRANAVANLQTAEVQRGTIVASINAAGAIGVPQSATLVWRASGTVAEVPVKVGDPVKKGDVLMALDPASPPASVIQAQADLIAAQQALDELLHPTDMDKANAQKAVADAQDALVKAQKALRIVQNPVGQGLTNAISDAKLALDNAQANLQLSNVSTDVAALQNQVFVTNWYRRQWEQAKAKYDASNASTDLKDAMDLAWNAYQIQLDKQLTLELRINTDKAGKTDAVNKAQAQYDTAVANLNAAQQGPDPVKLAAAQANVAVAQANLANVQQQLDQLTNPDPNDIATAKARILAAQTTVDSMRLVAPFTGTVVAVSNRVGDLVDNGQTALVLADVSSLQIQVDVSEVDINQVSVGQEVKLTADAAPAQTFKGTVSDIAYMGKSQQGVVTFPVMVVIPNPDPALKPGMTGAVSIVTDTHANVLLVPNRAVHTTGGQRTVTVLFEGQQISVPVTLGLTSSSVSEVLDGALKEGDAVVLNPTTATTGAQGGGFGLFGLLGGGGGSVRGGP